MDYMYDHRPALQLLLLYRFQVSGVDQNVVIHALRLSRLIIFSAGIKK